MPSLSLWAEKDHKLTGRQRQRQGVERAGIVARRDVMITQVEEIYTTFDATYGRDGAGYIQIRWRDATWKYFASIRIAPQSEENAA
jgi:hypothetical protein